MTCVHELRRAIIPLCSTKHFNDPCAVTLTMKQRANCRMLDPIECSRNFRHFANRLNKSVLGNAFTRHGNRLRMIPVLERSHGERWHYHTVIDRLDRIHRDEFANVVSDCWTKTPWGYRQIDIQHDISNGWINYITKFSQKTTYSDAMDWQNFHNPIAE